MSAALPPALARLRWNASPEELTAAAAGVQAHGDAVLQQVADAREATASHVLLPLMTMDRDMEAQMSSITFLKDVATDKAVRDAAAAAQAALSAWEVKASMREDVFHAVLRWCNAALGTSTLADAEAVVKAACDGTHAAPLSGELTALDAEARRFVHHTLRDYRRKGLHLPADKRALIEKVNTLISDLKIGYSKTLAEVNTKLHFTDAQLAGMPSDFVASLTSMSFEEAVAAAGGNHVHVKGNAAALAGERLYEVSLAYPHVVPLLKLCSVPETRAQVEQHFNSRAMPENVAVLEQLVTLRRYLAHVLGYKNFAAYVLEERMASSPDTVAKFLADLARDLRPLADADIASLQALKDAEEPGGGPISMSNYRYYMEAELKSKFSVDHDAIKSYFPLNTVITNMLHMYETLLSIKITKISLPAGATWHEEVEVYEVTDARAEVPTSGQAIGYFYLDLFPREGKYSHAAVFPLLNGCVEGNPLTDEGRMLPVCAMVCNFTKPTASTPSLLRHEEVVTLFHEFGHVTHHLLSNTRLHRFSSFRCEMDFVEAPSQMLENWCWEPATVRELSGHVDNPAEKLPMELAEKLYAARIAHAGLLNMRQIFLATFDQQLHTLPAIPAPEDLSTITPPADVNTEQVLLQLHEEVLRIAMTPGTNFGASFGHLAGGYEASYYSYMWSEVYAADMFETVFKAAPLSPESGLRYRTNILANGGRKDAADFLVDFLGRQPSQAAFLRSKGLTA